MLKSSGVVQTSLCWQLWAPSWAMVPCSGIAGLLLRGSCHRHHDDYLMHDDLGLGNCLAVNVTPHHSIRPLIDFNKIINCTAASRYLFFAGYIIKLGALLPPAMAPAS